MPDDSLRLESELKVGMPNKETAVSEITARPRCSPANAPCRAWRRRTTGSAATRPPTPGWPIGWPAVASSTSAAGWATARPGWRPRRPTSLGLDYDATAIGYAAATYAGPRRGFAGANLAALPVRTGAADVVTALQLIEHVWDHAEFLRECHRVLRPGGQLVVTTPEPADLLPRLDHTG